MSLTQEDTTIIPRTDPFAQDLLPSTIPSQLASFSSDGTRRVLPHIRVVDAGSARITVVTAEEPAGHRNTYSRPADIPVFGDAHMQVSRARLTTAANRNSADL